MGCEQAQRLVRAAELAARGGDAQIGEDLEHPSVVARLQLQESLWELALSELRLNRGLIGACRRTNLLPLRRRRLNGPRGDIKLVHRIRPVRVSRRFVSDGVEGEHGAVEVGHELVWAIA